MRRYSLVMRSGRNVATLDTHHRDAAFGIPGLDDILAGGWSASASISLRERQGLARPRPRCGSCSKARGSANGGSTSPSRRQRKSCVAQLEITTGRLKASTSSSWFRLSLLDEQQQQSLLYSSDLELGETTRMIFESVERNLPRRVVIDSLSEIRLLAQSSLRYRRQVLALKHYFAKHGATVLLLDDLTTDINDKTVHSVAHGVIQLQELAPEYGAERRRVRVIKYRGRRFRGGYHDFTIKTGGLEVYPRIVASEHHSAFARDLMSSGVAELDALLGGGSSAAPAP